MQQFNLNIERQLPGNVVLTVGYAGSRSAHILVSQLNENLMIAQRLRRSRRLHCGLRLRNLPLRGPLPERRHQQQHRRRPLRFSAGQS